MQLTELSNGKRVDSRIYPELQQMFDDARMAAEEYVARPGTSEHQLGLSVDINADTQTRKTSQVSVMSRGIIVMLEKRLRKP